MEENEGKLIIEVRKPEVTVENTQEDLVVDNEEKEVNNVSDVKAETIAHINEEVEKFQSEVSELYQKMTNDHKEEKNSWIPKKGIEKTQEIAIPKEERKFQMKADVADVEACIKSLLFCK